jgi:hypothetical protein
MKRFSILLFLLLVLQVSLVFAQNEGAIRMSDVAGEVIFDEAKEQVNSLPTSPENVSLSVKKETLKSVERQVTSLRVEKNEIKEVKTALKKEFKAERIKKNLKPEKDNNTKALGTLTFIGIIFAALGLIFIATIIFWFLGVLFLVIGLVFLIIGLVTNK